MRKSPLLGVEIDSNRKQTPTRKVKFGVAKVKMDTIKAHRIPGIVYSKGVNGKRARIAGSGIEVWEVIAVYKNSDKSIKRLQQAYHWLTEKRIKAALSYYSFYREEIDALIAENEQWSLESVKQKYPFITGKPVKVRVANAWDEEKKFITSLKKKRVVKGGRKWTREELYDRGIGTSNNPATGETIKIPAKKVVKFRVAKAAKDAILGKK